MTIRFYTERLHSMNTQPEMLLVKETSSSNSVVPQLNWSVRLEGYDYLVRNIRADYDSGIISVEIKLL